MLTRTLGRAITRALRGLWADLPPGIVDVLVEGSQLLSFARKAVVVLESDAADALFVVAGGQVRSSRLDVGRVTCLGWRLPGEIFGERCLSLAPTSYGETVEAVVASEIVRTPLDVLRVAMRDPTLSARLTEQLVARGTRLAERLTLAGRSVDERLAGALVELADSFGFPSDTGVVLKDVTHEQLGEYIAATRETISLALNRLRKEKLVARSVKDRQIVISNAPGLRARAHGLRCEQDGTRADVDLAELKGRCA